MSPQGKSLVLVTVDCLRADHCGFYGYSRPATPFLDTLAKESFVLPTAFVAGAPTYFSLPAILASRMPLALGREVIGLAPGETTLASALREGGYATAAFAGANPYISPRFGYDQGFDVFKDFLDREGQLPQSEGASTSRSRKKPSSTRSKINQTLKRTAHAIGLGTFYDEFYFQYRLRLANSAAAGIDALRRFPTAETVVGRAVEWLEIVGQKPFFLWLHLMDPHSPYYPTAAAYRELTGKEIRASRAQYLNEFWNRSDIVPAKLHRKKDSVLELYDAGIRSVDTQIARLVSQLQKSGAWGDCVFALTADHGEEFLEHGGRYHAPVGLHEEIVRVPLLIRVPGVAKTDAPTSGFSHLHLAPTLLDVLEMPQPASFRGTSLWGNIRDGRPWDDNGIMECINGCTNPLRREDRMGARLLGIRTSGHKLTMRMGAASTEDLYDLQADPAEKQPIEPTARKEIRRQALSLARKHMEEVVSSENVKLRLKARLQDLRVELQSKSH